VLVRTCRIHLGAAVVQAVGDLVEWAGRLADAHLSAHPDGRDIDIPVPDDLAVPVIRADSAADGPADPRSDRDREAVVDADGQAHDQADGHGPSDRHPGTATCPERRRPPRAPLERRGRADLRHGWSGR
jgi:hypothetical protein